MSHSFIFLKFKNGDADTVSIEAVRDVLSRHGLAGAMTEGLSELRAPVDASGDTPIGEVSVHVKAGEVTEVSIDRPRYQDGCRRLCFDLVTQLGLAMISSGGEVINCAPDTAHHLPDGIDAQFAHANLNVTALEQMS